MMELHTLPQLRALLSDATLAEIKASNRLEVAHRRHEQRQAESRVLRNRIAFLISKGATVA